jgi:hypothetical protein
MPTIRPEDLKNSARFVAGALGEPDRLTSLLLELLESYRDRTRRPAQTTRAVDAAPAFDVPALVLSRVSVELESGLSDTPESRMPVARSLWETGYREARLLAIALVKGAAWPETVDFAESVARGLTDRNLIKMLAREGLSGWETANPRERLGPFARWVKSRSPELQLLAMDALVEQVETADLNEYPGYFPLLAGVARIQDRNLANVLREVLIVMARRSPAETAQFLLDEFRGNNRRQPFRRLASDLTERFPPAQRDRLERALAS